MLHTFKENFKDSVSGNEHVSDVGVFLFKHLNDGWFCILQG